MENEYLRRIAVLEQHISQLIDSLEKKEARYTIPVPDYGYVVLNDYGEPIQIYLSRDDIPEGVKAFEVEIK